VSKDLHPLMNNTKWDELRVAMFEHPKSPKWRTCDAESGYVSDWDGEWFYHFRGNGYESILWVELLIESDEQREAIISELVQIGLPGYEKDGNLFVVGYTESGQTIDYFRQQ